MKTKYNYVDKYKTAAAFNKHHKSTSTYAEVTDFPKTGDHYLTYTRSPAWTNSKYEVLVNVYGLASGVPLKHIRGIE